jgi:hypothetical protein
LRNSASVIPHLFATLDNLFLIVASTRIELVSPAYEASFLPEVKRMPLSLPV